MIPFVPRDKMEQMYKIRLGNSLRILGKKWTGGKTKIKSRIEKRKVFSLIKPYKLKVID